MKRILLIALLSLFQFAFSQSKGTIKGTVTDKDMNGEPLPFANVFIKGTTIGSTTEMDGTFTLQVPAGNQTIVFSFVGYQTVEKPVNVVANKTVTVTQELGASEGQKLEEVKINATVSKEKESALLLEQKKAVEIQTKIGAQELSRKGVSDAQGAVAKVSGISKQEGVKNVFVRGLGDRYNATFLNGFPIPSEDPEYKNIALDFFGTDIIKNIGVSKVFNSTKIGDVGGARINISSKELNKGKIAKIGLSGGINTQVLKNDFFEQDGVNYLGFSNKKQPGDDVSNFGFKNSLDPKKSKQNINHGFDLSLGKKFSFENDNSLSLFAVASHGVHYSQTNQVIRNTNTTGNVFSIQDGIKSSKNITQLGLFNSLYKIKNKHKLFYNFLAIHSNNQYVGKYKGTDSEKFQGAEDDESGYLIRQQNNDNILLVNQLSTKWQLSDIIGLELGGSFNYLKGNEPDRRVTSLLLTNKKENTYKLTPGTGSQSRFFLKLKEKDYNGKFALSFRLNGADDKISKLTLGYNYRNLKDSFNQNEYAITPSLKERFNLDELVLDNYFNQNLLDRGEISMIVNFDSYNASKKIHSGYTNFTYKVNEEFIANVGFSIDDINLGVNYNVEQGKIGSSEISKLYVLPSANIKYNVSEKSSFRLGSSKTYTLPQSKEISPYKYIDIAFISQGNENLQPSENYNLDLKFEHFFSRSELISLTGFYKFIEDPISRVQEGGSARVLTYKNIAKKADVVGIELEVRKNIFENEENNTKLSSGMNASYIYSEMEVDVLNTEKKISELEGSAPFLINADITFNTGKDNNSFTSSLIMNYFSDRIHTVGTVGFENIIEKGVVGLDFISSYSFNKNLSLKLKAKNLLNPTYSLSRKSSNSNEKTVLKSYSKGIDFSLGISYKL